MQTHAYGSMDACSDPTLASVLARAQFILASKRQRPMRLLIEYSIAYNVYECVHAST